MHDDDRAHDYRGNLFDLPLSEWSDDDLRVGARAVCERRDEVAAGEPWVAEQLNAVACVLAEERDRRTALYRDAEQAMAGAVVYVDTAEILPDGRGA